MEEYTKAYEANSDNMVRDVHNYFNFLKERSIDHEKQGYMALCGVDRDSSDAAVRVSGLKRM